MQPTTSLESSVHYPCFPPSLSLYLNSFVELKQRHDAHQTQGDLAVLQEADVVGMTTTGVAMNQALVEALGAKIVVVEEAAEARAPGWRGRGLGLLLELHGLAVDNNVPLERLTFANCCAGLILKWHIMATLFYRPQPVTSHRHNKETHVILFFIRAIFEHRPRVSLFGSYSCRHAGNGGPHLDRFDTGDATSHSHR